MRKVNPEQEQQAAVTRVKRRQFQVRHRLHLMTASNQTAVAYIPFSLQHVERERQKRYQQHLAFMEHRLEERPALFEREAAAPHRPPYSMMRVGSRNERGDSRPFSQFTDELFSSLLLAEEESDAEDGLDSSGALLGV